MTSLTKNAASINTITFDSIREELNQLEREYRSMCEDNQDSEELALVYASIQNLSDLLNDLRPFFGKHELLINRKHFLQYIKEDNLSLYEIPDHIVNRIDWQGVANDAEANWAASVWFNDVEFLTMS